MCIKSIKNKVLLTAMALISYAGIAAQDTKTPVAQTVSGNNQLATLLLIMIVVLAFVIWGMGQVLTALGRQLLDKSKSGNKVLSIVLLVGFSLLSQVSFAQDAATTAVQSLPNYGGLSATTFYLFITVLSIEVVVILFLAFSIRRMYTELLPQKTVTAKETAKLSAWWYKMDKKLFTKAVSVEKEADILLDHNYDGIKELDNALPPWWKYGFYITIGVAFIYLLNFHVLGSGLNPTQEYNAEIEKARVAKEIYDAQNKDRVDENNVLMADADGIKAGQALFEANCVACHLKDGGGSVGPNLTDNYWLHKGSLNDIFHTISYGYADKGMQAWNSKFSPKEISQLSSFIKTLKGTKPAIAKDPQGEIFEDSPANGVDSIVVVKTDSAGAKK